MTMNRYICVPITESGQGEFIEALREADGQAEAIELRLDYLDSADLPGVLAWLKENVRSLRSALVLTFRPREQGGRRDVSLGERQAFWRGLPAEILEVAEFADFELDLVESWRDEEPPLPWEKVICSWHDFEGTPEYLFLLYERMEGTPAAVVKIAAQANRIDDCLPIFETIDYARGKKPVIALGMGLPGMATRVLGLSRGAMLTFAALRKGAESAAGQPTIQEMRELYRVQSLNRESEIYGVIGNPVGHSRSPRIHNSALAALGRDGVYLPLAVENLARFVKDFIRHPVHRIDWQLRGLSVTIPHKVAIIDHLDFIDKTARQIGAVNTLVIKDKKLLGYNTDVIGAMKPLERMIELKGARAAIIGAGGSARAICHGLRERGAETTIYARNVEKAWSLADEFDARVAGLDDFAGETDLVINCTPIGMHGHSEGQSPLKPESLSKVDLVYDLIYTPEETALLRAAREAGCRTLGGLAMLVGQAAEQFRLWTGLEAPIETMWEAARQWTSLPGKIARGHQVASRASEHYPQGTIAMQAPFFLARGLDLSGFYHGTLNISLAPRQFSLKRATHYFPRVEWTTHHPPEDFSFCRCRVTYRGKTYQGWVYYPHPETKIRHHQDRSILEVIAPPIPDLEYGASVTVEVLPEEIEIS